MSFAPKHAILAAVLACFLLAYVSAKVQLPAIEQDLISRTEVALSGMAIANLRVTADGREIIITGAATEVNVARAGMVASNVFGVFRVRNRLQVVEGQTAPAKLPSRFGRVE